MRYHVTHVLGEMAERLNALPWKGSIRESVSGVRIPLSPQTSETRMRRENE